MPRAPRIHYPGAVYHVMARGVDGREIFMVDRDRSGFLSSILRLEIRDAALDSCVLPYGQSLPFPAIKVGNIPLSRIMHRLLTAHAVAFNEHNDREGHLFQSRYKSVLCLDDRYLIALIRYIHMNPVRAGLVAKPELWPWSSHRQYAERRDSPLVDTRLLFNALHDPIDQSEGNWIDRQDDDFKPWPCLKQRSPLLRGDRVEPASIEALASTLFDGNHSLSELRSGKPRRREVVRKRKLLAMESLKNGHSLLAVARWLGCTPSSHSIICFGEE